MKLLKSSCHVQLAEDCSYFEVMPDFMSGGVGTCYLVLFIPGFIGVSSIFIPMSPLFLLVMTTFMTKSYDLRGSISVMTPSDRRKASRSLIGF